jgi:Bacterial EndoU nuclease
MIPNPVTFFDQIQGRMTGGANFFKQIPNIFVETPAVFGTSTSLHDFGVPLIFEYGKYKNTAQRMAGIETQLELNAASFASGGAAKSGVSAIRNFRSLEGVTNLASTSRTSHILAGDGLFSSSGGHAWFRSIRSTYNGIFRQKSMFPMSWSNGKIMTAVNEVATSPFSRAINQTGRQGSFFTNGGAPARIANFGTYDGITLRVITEGNIIKTAHPWFKPIP